jgi:hypothetical protein
VDALEATTVAGVSRTFTQGPPLGSPGVTDCPFQYVRFPEGDEIPLVFGEQGGDPTLRAEFVVCIEPVGQSTAPENFDATVDMMDAVTAGLRALSCITKSHLNWSLRLAMDIVAGQMYWAVIASVEGRG